MPYQDPALKALFLAATVVQTIVKMNLLIAVISDTFESVQNSRKLADAQATLELIYEAEVTMLWNRKKETLQYIHGLLPVGDEEENWEGRFVYFGKQMNLSHRAYIQQIQNSNQDMKKEIGETKKEIDERISDTKREILDTKKEMEDKLSTITSVLWQVAEKFDIQPAN